MASDHRGATATQSTTVDQAGETGSISPKCSHSGSSISGTSDAGGPGRGHVGPADRRRHLFVRRPCRTTVRSGIGTSATRIGRRVPVRGPPAGPPPSSAATAPASRSSRYASRQVGHRGQRQHPGDRAPGPGRGARTAPGARRRSARPAAPAAPARTRPAQRRGGQRRQRGDAGAARRSRVPGQPPPGCAGAAVLDLGHRVAERGQRGGERAGVGPVVLGPPEPAVHDDHQRPGRRRRRPARRRSATWSGWSP